MSLVSSVSQQLHNTILNKATFMQEGLLTVIHIMNYFRLSSIIIYSTKKMKINFLYCTHCTIK